ncbi:MAG: prepilin-type N-terminal cleavage/methylation domain-containing protein [Gemmatimonadota bacterium]
MIASRTNRTSVRRSSRAGFTLAELMIVATLMGIIGSLLTALLVRQQRFHRAVSAIADARARMRDIETILPTDLRGISTVGGDLYAISDTSIQFRAFTGASVLCAYVSGQPTKIELPPKSMAIPVGASNQVGTVLTAWINAPAVGDQVFLYNDSTSAGNADDSWTNFTVMDTASSAAFAPNSCLSSNATPLITAADDASPRYRLTLSAAPTQAQINVGAPIRIAREVRYSGYIGADYQWYVGYQTCTPSGTAAPGTCGSREVLAGPILPITADTTTSGLFFVFYDQYGTRRTSLTPADTIARISVGVRTSAESLRRATGSNATITGGDSLRFVVGIRNRI